MTISTLRDDVVRGYLLGLGDTAEEVAESLRTLGVEGHRSRPRMCPIANYLRRCGVDFSVVSDSEIRDGLSRSAVLMPRPVQEFIAAFDVGDLSL